MHIENVIFLILSKNAYTKFSAVPHDNFVRPYIGDVLVTILLCCLCRTAVPKGITLLPIYVFIFATLVEVAQYFDIVKILGVEGNPLLSTIIGTSFSFIDILCYGVGCLIFWIAEIFVLRKVTVLCS